jgi:arylsulfatase A-like enzyme
MAGHADLFPTLAELAGAAVPAGLPGSSLVPFVRASASSRVLPPRTLVSESWSPLAIAFGGVRRPFPGPAFAATLWPRKLARYQFPDGSVKYELYNLATDPAERANLWPLAAASSTDLREVVDRRQAIGADAQRSRKAKVGTAGNPAEAPAVDPAVQEKLKALGYVE